MTAIDRLPENVNFLSPLNFEFSIKKCPNVNFFIQSINLPGLSLPTANQPNPLVNIPHSGDHIEYDQLMVNFKVDEDLANYLEIHNWLRELGFPNNPCTEYANVASQPAYTGLGVKSDMTLLILSSARNPKFEVNFRDAFPVSLSSVVFDVTMGDVEFLEAAVTFTYTSYGIKPV